MVKKWRAGGDSSKFEHFVTKGVGGKMLMASGIGRNAGGGKMLEGVWKSSF